MIRNMLGAASISAFVVALSFSPAVLAVGPVKLRCFAGGEAECVAPTNDAATFSVPAGGWAGVYLNSRSTSGKYLSQVSFSFVSNGDVGGGAPRFSIPVSLSGTHDVDAYAFIDVNSCNSPTVSTDSPTCRVYFGAESFVNWAEFAATYPMAMVAPGRIPFIISDVPGEYSVTNIVLR